MPTTWAENILGLLSYFPDCYLFEQICQDSLGVSMKETMPSSHPKVKSSAPFLAGKFPFFFPLISVKKPWSYEHNNESRESSTYRIILRVFFSAILVINFEKYIPWLIFCCFRVLEWWQLLFLVFRLNTLAAYMITPAMGAHFTMYLASMSGNSEVSHIMVAYISEFLVDVWMIV